MGYLNYNLEKVASYVMEKSASLRLLGGLGKSIPRAGIAMGGLGKSLVPRSGKTLEQLLKSSPALRSLGRNASAQWGSGSKAMRRLLSNAATAKNVHGPAAQAVKRIASKNPTGSFAVNTLDRGVLVPNGYVDPGAVKNLLRNVYPKGGLLHPNSQSLVRPETARAMSSNIVW